MMSGTVLFPENSENYFCTKILAAVEFSKSKVNIKVESSESKGKPVPRYESGSIVFTENNAICRSVSSKSLWGDNEFEKSAVYQWIEFADVELYIPGSVWTFPILGIKSYNKQDFAKAKSDLENALKCLNSHLETRTYLAGDRVTQADIACAAALYLPSQLVLDKKTYEPYPNMTRWFTTVINQPEFRKVLKEDNEIQICEKAEVFDGKKYAEMQKQIKALKDKPKKENSKDSKNQDDENSGAGDKPKSAAQLKKEAKKREKMEKFNAKKSKMEEQKKAQQQKKPSEKPEKKKAAAIIKYEKDTKVGEKKDISGDMPDSYSPKYVEAAWYGWWRKNGFFKPEYGRKSVYEANPKGMFMMCLPPPNVTGKLHLGHALTNTVEDVLTRWHRMRGETTLWNPGCDHAGIATQVVVERKLKRERNISRHDIGREAFLKEVWKWKEEKGNSIYEQLRSLGSSLDWDREFFTMDDKLSRAVKEVFVRLHDEGVIFRSNRLINWSCALKSAISDIEVDKRDLPGRTLLNVPGYDKKIEFGVLVSFAYPVIDGKPGEEVIVATTRLETMLGDTAVAVHPEDERYKHLHGKFVQHPFCDRKIPVICDEMVDREFGTGAVKITPAHDPNDYDCGKRHNLPFITMLSDTGEIANTNTRFDGMKRFIARSEVEKDLKEKNLYHGTKDNPMVVPICSRSKDIVEPMIKAQWFVNCNDMARRSVEAVKSGELKLVPDIHNKTWFMWLENIRDWCISRQLWWGHRIPAYFATVDDPSVPPGQRTDGKYWFSGRDEKEALAKAVKAFKVDESKISLEQDHDVLDTWFSSGLLPFSIFGWPDETPDLKYFFPGTLLETGHDILFFWVARMVMFSLHLTDKLPFKEVYLHAMVRDAHGRKMSKSLGNVIDPSDVINGITLEELHQALHNSNLEPREVETAKTGQKADYPDGIPECGSDALRFALCAYTCQGRDINLDVNRILGYRHFCNKLWNAVKFSLRSLGDNFVPKANFQPDGTESIIDKWILNKLSRAVATCEEGFNTYQFPSITTAIYNFWLYELCDVYLECLKPVFSGADASAIKTSRNVLYTCLEVALRLTSPLMPFITEELWQRLPQRKENERSCPSVMVSEYPGANKYSWAEDAIDSEMDLISSIIKTTRSLRADYNLTKTKAEVFIHCTDESLATTIAKYTEAVKTLSYSSNIKILTKDEKAPSGCAVGIVNDKCDVNLMLKGLIDLEKEIMKLRKKQAENGKKIQDMEKKMAKEEYSSKVPKKVQEAESEKVQQLKTELKKMQEAEKSFVSMMS
ncbi:valine--tRNA ligase-like [Styela clava]